MNPKNDYPVYRFGYHLEPYVQALVDKLSAEGWVLEWSLENSCYLYWKNVAISYMGDQEETGVNKGVEILVGKEHERRVTHLPLEEFVDTYDHYDSVNRIFYFTDGKVIKVPNYDKY